MISELKKLRTKSRLHLNALHAAKEAGGKKERDAFARGALFVLNQFEQEEKPKEPVKEPKTAKPKPKASPKPTPQVSPIVGNNLSVEITV